MTCPMCADKGLVRLRYRDGSTDQIAVCLCPMGQTMRNDVNARKATGFPLWMAWAAREQVAQERIVFVEDVLDDADLVRIPRAESAHKATSIAEAMRTKTSPRL